MKVHYADVYIKKKKYKPANEEKTSFLEIFEPLLSHSLQLLIFHTLSYATHTLAHENTYASKMLQSTTDVSHQSDSYCPVKTAWKKKNLNFTRDLCLVIRIPRGANITLWVFFFFLRTDRINNALYIIRATIVTRTVSFDCFDKHLDVIDGIDKQLNEPKPSQTCNNI